MRTYYEDAQIRVSSSVCSVGARHYPIGDIEWAWRVGHRRVGRRAAFAIALLLLCSGVQLACVLAAGRWPPADSLTLTMVAILVIRATVRLLTAPAAIHAVEDLRRYGRRWELWAIVAGCPVLLLHTDDAIRHGQVCRALARALTSRASGSPGRRGPSSSSRSPAARRRGCQMSHRFFRTNGRPAHQRPRPQV